MTERTRPLSARQAFNCENAATARCRCRCGGRLHGAKRVGAGSDPAYDAVSYSELPTDDPHYLPRKGSRDDA